MRTRGSEAIWSWAMWTASVYRDRRQIGRFHTDRSGGARGLSRYIVKKGSVAVDGISLTVNDQRDNRFMLNVIPHSSTKTTIGSKNPGDQVNVEIDIIGRYVERFVAGEAKAGLDLDFLYEYGYIKGKHMGIARIEDVIEDVRQGKMVIMVDDEDRENEGDVVIAAEKVTPEAINFMARYALRPDLPFPHRGAGRGASLPLMVQDNTLPVQHGFHRLDRSEGGGDNGHIRLRPCKNRSDRHRPTRRARTIWWARPHLSPAWRATAACS